MSISIPLDWCNAIPNSVSGTATVATNGYEADGTPVGSTTVTVTIEVPTSVKPSVGGVAAERISFQLIGEMCTYKISLASS